jgi:hypothetical protein
MKRIVLIGTLLLVFVLTAGTASAQIILPPGWPFLPPIIAPPRAYYPNPYGYYSYPYGYYGSRGPGYWGYSGRGYYGSRGPGYWGYSGRGYYGSRGPIYRGYGGYRR